MSDPTKRCPACTRTKPLGEFGADRIRKDGLTRTCRRCSARARREQVARRVAGQARPRGKPPKKIAPGEPGYVRPLVTTPRIAMIRFLDTKAQHDAEVAAR